MSLFKNGDKVWWNSQAAGYSKTKIGRVREVVPSGQLPSRDKFPSLHRGVGVGMPRKHESYVVVVGKTKAYWPVVNRLHLHNKDTAK